MRDGGDEVTAEIVDVDLQRGCPTAKGKGDVKGHP